jgi:PBP superfamily domain
VRRRYRLPLLLMLCAALWSSTLVDGFGSGSAEGLTVSGSQVSARLVREIVGAKAVTRSSGAPDVVRTTAGPSGDNAGARDGRLRYFAMALDAVTWATTSPRAPKSMTLEQLRDVFACRITNWAQLPGGHAGRIQRVMPPAGSGTAIEFTRLLGGVPPFATGRVADPAAYGPQDRGCPAVLTMKENRGTSPTFADRRTAARSIFPYSAGTWVRQAADAVGRRRDARGRVRLGAIVHHGVEQLPVRDDGSGPQLDPTVVREPDPTGAHTTFPGAYYLYNAVSSGSPRYGSTVAVVGFDPADPTGEASSPLCKGAERSAIVSAGFLPLARATESDVTCRLETPVQSGLTDEPSIPPVTTAAPTPTTTVPPTTVPPTTSAPTTVPRTTVPPTTRPPVTAPPATTPPPTTPPVASPPRTTAARLFSAGSLWNSVKAATSFAAAADATIQGRTYGLNNSAFSHPFYRATSSDPMTTFRLGAGWGKPATTMVTRAPAGMHQASGSDAVMSVLLVDGTLLDMYGVSGGGTEWTATFYGTSDGTNGPGFGEQGTWASIGTTAIGSPQAAGTVLASDVTAGVIPHALFIAYDYVDEGGVGTSGAPSVAPAVSHDDGGGPGPLPQGGLLVATGSMPSGLNAMEQALWTAAKTYGVYVCDQLGGGPMFYGDGSATVEAAFTGNGLTKIGRSLRLVENWG